MVSIHRPLGYEPSTLPLRHPAFPDHRLIELPFIVRFYKYLKLKVKSNSYKSLTKVSKFQFSRTNVKEKTLFEKRLITLLQHSVCFELLSQAFILSEDQEIWFLWLSRLHPRRINSPGAAVRARALPAQPGPSPATQEEAAFKWTLFQWRWRCLDEDGSRWSGERQMY